MLLVVALFLRSIISILSKYDERLFELYQRVFVWWLTTQSINFRYVSANAKCQ
jgi:hypothetical protein